MTEINNKNFNIKNVSFGNSPKIPENSYENTIGILRDNMLERCEREIPEYGDFAPIKENLKNNNEKIYAGNIMLTCTPSKDNPTKRYLTYSQMNPQNGKGLTCLIGAGNKDEILAMLQDENFINDRKEDCDRIIDKMKLLRW